MVPAAFLAAALTSVGSDARAQGSSYGRDGTGSSYPRQGATGASPYAGQGSGFNVDSGATSSAWNDGMGGWNGGGGAGAGTSSHGQPRAYWEPQARSSYWELSTYNQGSSAGAGGRSAAGGAGFDAGPPPPGGGSSVLGPAAFRPASPYIQPNPMYPRAANSPYGQASAGAYLANSPYGQAGAGAQQTGSLYPQTNSAYSPYPQTNSAYSPYPQANSPYYQTNSPFSQLGRIGAFEPGVAFPRLDAGTSLGTGAPPPEIEPRPFTAAAAARNAGAALLQLNAAADLRNTQAAQLNGLYP